MTKISRLAIVAALVLGAGATPGLAKEKAPAGPAPIKLSREVQTPLSEAQKLTEAQQFDAALAKINEADAVKKTADDAYMISNLRINAGIGKKDNAVIAQGLEGALATGKVPAADQPRFLRNLGAIALQANDYPRAIQQYERLMALMPTDDDVVASLSELYQRNKQTPQAIATLEKGVAAKKAAGGTVPESWYRNELAFSYDARLYPQANAAAAQLVAAYPTNKNWDDAISVFRDGKLDDPTSLDALRLKRAVGAMAGERDYSAYAELAQSAGLSPEAKSVYDEGVAKGQLTPNKAYVKELGGLITTKYTANKGASASLERDARGPKGTGKVAAAAADGYLAEANYAKAIDLYKLALDKGSVDANVVNTRLGIAYAKSGNKAEAATAFQKVAAGTPRGQLAQLWLAYVNHA